MNNKFYKGLIHCYGNVCTNFVNFSPIKLAKQNRKIIQIKYLLKLKILWVQSKK